MKNQYLTFRRLSAVAITDDSALDKCHSPNLVASVLSLHYLEGWTIEECYMATGVDKHKIARWLRTYRIAEDGVIEKI